MATISLNYSNNPIGGVFSGLAQLVTAFKSTAYTETTQSMTLKNNQTLLSKVLSSATAATNQSQQFIIGDTKGDVTVSNNTGTQTADIGLQSAFKAASTQQAQQDLTLAVQQTAKSVAKGVNINQSTSSVNNSTTYIDTSSSISNEIMNTCLTDTNQLQNIEVTKTGGTVLVTQNGFNQIAKELATCFSDVVQNQTSLQQLDVSIAQSATAETIGIDLAMVLIIVAIIVAMALGGYAVFGTQIFDMLKQLLPFIICGIIVIIGVVVAIWGWFKSTTDINITSFAKSIESSCAGAVVSSTSTVQSLQEAGNACKSNALCQGFDVIAYTTSPDGKSFASNNDPLVVKYYSSVPSPCQVEVDNVNLIYTPTFGSGASAPPPGTRGVEIFTPNIWLNTNTSEWFLFDQQKRVWDRQGQFSSTFLIGPTSAAWAPGSADIVVTPSNAVNVASFSLDYKGDVRSIPGPGFFKNVPAQPNVSGVKRLVRPWAMIGAGVAMVLAGAGGAALALIFMPPPPPKKNPPPINDASK